MTCSAAAQICTVNTAKARSSICCARLLYMYRLCALIDRHMSFCSLCATQRDNRTFLTLPVTSADFDVANSHRRRRTHHALWQVRGCLAAIHMTAQWDVSPTRCAAISFWHRQMHMQERLVQSGVGAHRALRDGLPRRQNEQRRLAHRVQRHVLCALHAT